MKNYKNNILELVKPGDDFMAFNRTPVGDVYITNVMNIEGVVRVEKYSGISEKYLTRTEYILYFLEAADLHTIYESDNDNLNSIYVLEDIFEDVDIDDVKKVGDYVEAIYKFAKSDEDRSIVKII